MLEVLSVPGSLFSAANEVPEDQKLGVGVGLIVESRIGFRRRYVAYLVFPWGLHLGIVLMK